MTVVVNFDSIRIRKPLCPTQFIYQLLQLLLLSSREGLLSPQFVNSLLQYRYLRGEAARLKEFAILEEIAIPEIASMLGLVRLFLRQFGQQSCSAGSSKK
jgi:hypothetical protein